jgi:hypothetical protein
MSVNKKLLFFAPGLYCFQLLSQTRFSWYGFSRVNPTKSLVPVAAHFAVYSHLVVSSVIVRVNAWDVFGQKLLRACP